PGEAERLPRGLVRDLVLDLDGGRRDDGEVHRALGRSVGVQVDGLAGGACRSGEGQSCRKSRGQRQYTARVEAAWLHGNTLQSRSAWGRSTVRLPAPGECYTAKCLK